MSAIDLAAISAAQTRLLAKIGKPIELLDPGTGKRVVVSPADAAHPEAYLPIFLISAETLWLELTGTGFALDVSRTPDSALGYAVRKVRAGSFTVMMLCLIDVTMRLAEMDDALVLNHLIDFWGEAHGRIADVAPTLQGAT
ncbi:hypothetical protein K6L44_06785 [Gluconacetobacter entanii]|uniref:hypothetical protein n=1 Tax=Gluconacetobacter entanii TaxID=108528 RepID=UPI001C936B33|nr:hypothetical protein [Gluconacetobacter entanii]MBY4639705.1 hypothetical protein [Gluconacetobacter entanii]MCW4580340.1 hypothetical protein [Gluconacetobacter entanii]MCW4583669.1 hypothetical protein [Gluconacetobacter entanii]MCW4587051.1 hypothetical protein [Gluconacetobacter entanii]